MVRLRPVWITNHPPSVLWHCWLGHQTCKNRRPYNLYCVGADVKPCSINQSIAAWQRRCEPEMDTEETAVAVISVVTSNGSLVKLSARRFRTSCSLLEIRTISWYPVAVSGPTKIPITFQPCDKAYLAMLFVWVVSSDSPLVMMTNIC